MTEMAFVEFSFVGRDPERHLTLCPHPSAPALPCVGLGVQGCKFGQAAASGLRPSTASSAVHGEASIPSGSPVPPFHKKPGVLRPVPLFLSRHH